MFTDCLSVCLVCGLTQERVRDRCRCQSLTHQDSPITLLSATLSTRSSLASQRPLAELIVLSATHHLDPRWAHLCATKDRSAPEVCVALADEMSALLVERLSRYMSEVTTTSSPWVVCVIPPRLGGLVKRGVSPQHLFAKALIHDLNRFKPTNFTAIKMIHAPHLLKRVKSTPRQRTLSRAERRVAQRDAFKVRRCESPQRVLLIDDVLTTGGTLLAGVEALRKAGASQVIGVTMFKVA